MNNYKYVRNDLEDSYGILKLQDKILEIMVYIDQFCKENDIKYFLMGGSALGAMRHKGFIPWDDDLDIFMDYENQKHLPDRNNILYGHYVYDGALKGTMFSDLHKYKEKSFYDKHSSFNFLTEEKSYQIEIFSVYIAHISQSSWKIHFENDKDFEQWLKEIRSYSIYETNTIPEIHNQVVTLSTCTLESDNYRLIIHGILKEISK